MTTKVDKELLDKLLEEKFPQLLPKCASCGARIHSKDIAYRNGQPVCERCK